MTTGNSATSGPVPVDPVDFVDDEPAVTLRQLDEVRQRTRAAVHPAWFPMLLFGTLGLASIPFGLLLDGAGVGLFWLVAGPAGGFATSRHYRRQAMMVGAGVRGRAHATLGVALFVAAWVGGAVTNSAAVPMFAIAVAYLGFARLERSRPIALVAAALGVAAIAVGVTDPPGGGLLLTAAFGLSFTATGLLLRRHDPVG